MEDLFVIKFDRWAEGSSKPIDITVSPEQLHIPNDPYVAFDSPIHCKGKVTLVDKTLVFEFSLQAAIRVACTICNGWVDREISLQNICETVEVEPSWRTYSFKDNVRDLLLLEIPSRAECEGSCPERQTLAKYLR